MTPVLRCDFMNRLIIMVHQFGSEVLQIIVHDEITKFLGEEHVHTLNKQGFLL